MKGNRMDISKEEIRQFRDNPAPTINSPVAALWQQVLETRELRESIERKLDRLIELAERIARKHEGGAK